MLLIIKFMSNHLTYPKQSACLYGHLVTAVCAASWIARLLAFLISQLSLQFSDFQCDLNALLYTVRAIFFHQGYWCCSNHEISLTFTRI
jgi:hypothetical protein